MPTPIITLVREVIRDEGPGADFKALTNAVVDRMKVEGGKPPKDLVVLVLTLELMTSALEDALAKSGTKYVPKTTGADGWVIPAGRVGGLGSLLPTVADDEDQDNYEIVVGPGAEITRRGKSERVVTPVEPGPPLIEDFVERLAELGDLTKRYEAIGPLGLLATGTGFAWHLKVIEKAAGAATKQRKAA